MTRQIDGETELFRCCYDIASTLFEPRRLPDLTNDQRLNHRLTEIWTSFKLLDENYHSPNQPFNVEPLPEFYLASLQLSGRALLKILSLYPSVGETLSSTAIVLRELIGEPTQQREPPPSPTQPPRLVVDQNDSELQRCVEELEENVGFLHPSVWRSNRYVPFIGVPTGRTPRFVSRKSQIGALDNAFRNPGRSGQGAICVLTGPDGAGKTEIAAQYAIQRKNDFSGGVFWITHNNVWTDAAKLIPFAKHGMGLEHPDIDTFAVLRSFLEMTKDVLIIYDGLDPWNLAGNDDLADFVGLGMKASLIITSTTVPPFLSEFKCPTHVLKVGDLPEEDAINHFLFLLARKKPGSLAEPREVSSILGSISCSPRALERATDYLSRTATRASEYAERLQDSRKPKVNQAKIVRCDDIESGSSLLIRVDTKDSIRKEIYRSYDQLVSLDSNINDLFGLFIETKYGSDYRLPETYDSENGRDQADRFLQRVIELPMTSCSKLLEDFLELGRDPIPAGPMPPTFETYPTRGRSLISRSREADHGSAANAESYGLSRTPTAPSISSKKDPLQRTQQTVAAKNSMTPEPQNAPQSVPKFGSSKDLSDIANASPNDRATPRRFRQKLASFFLCHKKFRSKFARAPG
ncbi:hypothetical protein FGG08_006125 [Glutinoglossum americanum]|uniref:NB-ARC domain-containing protein n=1 Tax=Glutinoglossum americanum TaxID=1670608 RepID=A0A9P8HT93_9PEZI|nr:hypothetical protein FGG08_006125 [Glutinoglossum americanum]